MLWIFNGSVQPTQPGMIPGLGWRSGQGGGHSRVLLFDFVNQRKKNILLFLPCC